MQTDAPKPGVHAYVGESQSGKTTLAWAEFLAFCRTYRCGGLVVDMGRANNFKAQPHVATLVDHRQLRRRRNAIGGERDPRRSAGHVVDDQLGHDSY